MGLPEVFDTNYHSELPTHSHNITRISIVRQELNHSTVPANFLEMGSGVPTGNKLGTKLATLNGNTSLVSIISTCSITT